VLRAVPEITVRGRWAATIFLSGGWMHNNVKVVLRDENIQVNIIRRVVGGNTPLIEQN